MNAPKILVSTEIVDSVRGSLFPKNSVGRASVDFYVAALAAAGIENPDSLSFAESVEVTRRLYAASADFRRAIASGEAAKREAEREAKRVEREAAKREALKAKRAALEAELRKLGG